MSNNNLWFGYLDAGEKSSPVVMDSKLNTANPGTVYLYNHKRGEIIEYRRDIIEAKLRPLNDGESNSEKTLKSAYTQVRNGFSPRGGKVISIPEKAVQKTAVRKELPVEDEGVEMDDELDSLITEGGDEEWDDD